MTNSLSLKPEMRQQLSPRLLQSMKILQMNSQELLRHLDQVSAENPLLEQAYSDSLRGAYESLRQRVSWLDGGPALRRSEGSFPEQGTTDRETESLAAFLCDQLERKRLSKPVLALTKYMAELLDEDGYLTAGDLDSLRTLSIPEDLIQEALSVLHCLERRGSTLRRCAEAILETQRPFFMGQTAELAPMSLTSLSKRLDLHPSTISRAIRDKYLQCRQGTYPLRYFLNRAVGGQGVSRQGAKQRLLLLIQQENPCHPLSDQRLCELLAEDHGQIARRTVAKYRMELGIPSSAIRKKR